MKPGESGSKVFVGSDHAGFPFKTALLQRLRSELPGLELEDLGTDSEQSADYPEFARKVGEAVVREGARGLLICGSGIGMSIAANKVAGVRAANVWDVTSARLSRQHNDANLLCLGARLTGLETGLEATKVWLTTPFEGGRHQRRIDLIHRMEES